MTKSKDAFQSSLDFWGASDNADPAPLHGTPLFLWMLFICYSLSSRDAPTATGFLEISVFQWPS